MFVEETEVEGPDSDPKAGFLKHTLAHVRNMHRADSNSEPNFRNSRRAWPGNDRWVQPGRQTAPLSAPLVHGHVPRRQARVRQGQRLEVISWPRVGHMAVATIQRMRTLGVASADERRHMERLFAEDLKELLDLSAAESAGADFAASARALSEDRHAPSR